MSIASWIALLMFLSIILSSILAFIIGFFRGLFKTTIKTLIKAIFIIVWIFVTPAIAKSISNIDLSGLNIPNFTINNNTVVVTTISETVANIITSLNIVSPINGLSIYSFIVTVAELIICYVIFFVMLLVSNLLVDLLSSLIYNGVFRWFYQVESYKENKARLKSEREYRKNSKVLGVLAKGLLNSDGSIFDKKGKHRLLKIGGGVLGFIVQFVFILIVCSPVTALFRIASDNKESIFTFAKNLAPSKTKAIDDTNAFIDDFSNSALSKIYTLPGGYYLDSLIMNRVATEEIYGYKINLDSLISSITDVANPIMTSDSITYQEGLSYVTYNYATLLSVSTVDSILSSILLPKNSSFYALIPPLIDVGLAMLSANTDFSLDILDFSNIDWSNDIESIQKIYDIVYSNAIESIIEGTSINPYNFKMNTSKYTDSDINAFCEAARIVGSTNAIRNNAPVIINSLGATLNAYGFNIFPTEIEEYKDIDWGDEFYIFSQALFRLLRLINIDIEANMNFTIIQDRLISAFKSKEDRVVLRDILLGKNGLLNSKLFSLLKKGDTLLTFLNDFLLDNLSGIRPYIEDERFIENVRSFNSRTVDEIKLEISYMFSIIDILADESSPFHWDDNFSFISENDFDTNTAQEIYNLLQIAKNSIVFSSLYPVVLKSYLINNFSEKQVSDVLFGLTPYSFNYEDKNFVDDVSKVILSMPDIVNLYQKLESPSSSKQEKLDAINIESLRVFLNVIANSDFFNPITKHVENNIEQKNINMEIILSKIFNSDLFASLELSLPSREKIANANWGNGTTSSITLPSGRVIQMPHDEIGNICLMIESIKNNTDYFSLNLEKLHLADFDLISSFESIFDLTSATINSDLFRESGVNSVISKLENCFADKNLSISFNDLRNYAYDDKNKYKLLDDLYSLKLLSNLFNNLDYNQLSNNPITYLRTINADSINAFLTTIATTNYSFDSKTDPVANIIYLSLHKFQIFDKYNLPDFSADVFNIKNYSGCSWVEATETKIIPINSVDYSFSCTSIGSVRNICSLFNKIKNDFYISKIKSGDYSSLDFRSWIIDEKVRESSLGDSVLSDMYIRKLSDIYGGYIVKKISKLIPNVPAFFFDSYRYISSSLIYGSDAINGLLLGDTLYDVNDALILLTTRINDNEIVANRMSDFTSLFSLNLLDNQEGLVERLSSNLKSLGKSKILSTKDTKYQFSPLGYYMYSLVEKNSEFAKFLIQGGEDSLSNLLKVKEVIHKIDNLNSIDDPYTNWQEEFNNYGELILNGNIINYSFYDYSFNKDIDRLRNIYDSLNNSELLHQYLIHRIKRICNDFNLSNYLRNTNGNIIYPLIFNKHLTNSPEDREYYSHDYNIIFDVLSNDDNTLNTIFLNKQLPDNITSYNAKLIYIISSLNIFKNNYHYIIYNLFNNSVFNLSKYLSSPNTYCYLEEGAITRIKEVFKSNSNFDINQDLVLLQNTLSYLETVKDLTLNNINDIKDNLNNNFFNTLFSSTYNSEYRSFLASELAAGFTMNLFSMNNEIKNHFNPYSEYNYYFSNNTYYYYINNEVGHQIDVLID